MCDSRAPGDAPDSPVVRRQAVTAAQDRSALEKKAYFLAALERGTQPTLAPLFEGQPQDVVGLRR